jgi:hypothetical protein
MYRTAQGKPIDMDSIRLSNENTIAVGNMKVNARGDQLGEGGSVIMNRNQAMDQHYKMHTPMASNNSQNIMQQHAQAGATPAQGVARAASPIPPLHDVDPSGVPFDPEPEDSVAPLRGSLAGSIANRNQ